MVLELSPGSLHVSPFRYEVIVSMVPASHHKMLSNIHKTQERLKRRKQQNTANQEEDEEEEAELVPGRQSKPERWNRVPCYQSVQWSCANEKELEVQCWSYCTYFFTVMYGQLTIHLSFSITYSDWIKHVFCNQILFFLYLSIRGNRKSHAQ